MTWKTIYSKRSVKLGGILREYRETKGYSLRAFEAITGISRTIIHKIEKGERRLDVVEFLELCEFLDANPQRIIKILQKNP